MALYILHSIFHLAWHLYVRLENFGAYYVLLSIYSILSFPEGYPVTACEFFPLIPPIPPSIFPSITCFRKQFLRNVLQILLTYVRHSFPPRLYILILLLSHYRSNWSSLSFSSTTLQNFPGNSDLLSEVSNFQHHRKPHIKSSILLVSSLCLSPICWWTLPLVECCFFPFNPGFNFTCTSHTICYRVTKILELFHILQLGKICHNLYWGMLPWVFPH